MNVLHLVLLWLLKIQASPTNASTHSRSLIVGGDPATSAAWVVVLRKCCGGTLISADMILTAEHCTCMKIGAEIDANIIDLDNPGADGQKSKIADSRGGFGDIRLVRVSPPFKLAESDQPGLHSVDLPTEELQAEEEVLITGFGVYKYELDNKGIESPRLLQTKAKKGTDRCKRGRICLMEDKVTCQGDSGSGAILEKCERKFIIGAVSFGPEDKGQCAQGKQTEFGDVMYRMTWIKKNWKEMSPSTFREPWPCGADPPPFPPPSPPGEPQDPEDPEADSESAESKILYLIGGVALLAIGYACYRSKNTEENNVPQSQYQNNRPKTYRRPQKRQGRR